MDNLEVFYFWIFGDFSKKIFLLMISNNSIVVRENTFYDSILLNLFSLGLWLRIWSVLANISCPLEKNEYSALVG